MNLDIPLFHKADSEDFVMLACIVLTQYSSVTYRHTHGHRCHS